MFLEVDFATDMVDLRRTKILARTQDGSVFFFSWLSSKIKSVAYKYPRLCLGETITKTLRRGVWKKKVFKVGYTYMHNNIL